MFQEVLKDFIERIREIGLEIFIFFHEREFDKDLFEDFGELQLISWLLAIGVEYFSCEKVNKLESEMIISLLL